MAAGLGFKTFASGEVLSATDVNGYLMQGINVFASTAARDAAITAPAEGQFAFTKDTNGLWYYDGAAWVASGATGDIEGVTAGVGISGGGTSGTVTITNSMATAIDAKGDLVAGTGADAFSRLAVGTNGTVLTADSAEATGLKWAAPAAGANWSLLSSTALSGSTTTVSGISGKDKIMILINGASSNTGSATISVRLNGITTYSYYFYGTTWNAPATYSANFLSSVGPGTPDNVIPIGNIGSSAGGLVSGYCFITGCNSSGVKIFEAAGGGNSGGSTQVSYNTGGYQGGSAVISNVSVFCDTGSFDAGTVSVYTSA